jgi:hypothetical protein
MVVRVGARWRLHPSSIFGRISPILCAKPSLIDFRKLLVRNGLVIFSQDAKITDSGRFGKNSKRIATAR